MGWSKFTPDEVERRRRESVAALKAMDAEAWEREYQETCDRLYWTRGQCCAGCDHWQSHGGLVGLCSAAGIVSGKDVLRSMGISFSSYMPAPGFPQTKAEHHCGKFRDDFDWSTLEHDYLGRIGALRNGSIKQKPRAYTLKALSAREGDDGKGGSR